MKKTKEIFLTLVTIALLSILAVGATYALFTSEAKVNTTISSAKVEIDVELTSLELYSLGVKQDGYYFQNGGSATVNDEGEIELLYVSPGDKVVAHYNLENDSNITILYNVTFVINGELASGLVTSVDGTTPRWTELQPNQSIEDLVISVELPLTASNEYQNKSANILVLIKAIQGNADPQISTAEELQNELNYASQNPNTPTVLSLDSNLSVNTPLVVKAGTFVEINLNGNDILPSSVFNALPGEALVKVEQGASLKLTDTSGKVRYGSWVDGKYVISDVNNGNADVIVGGNVSLGSDAENFQLSTFINHGTLTLDGVSIAGAYALEGNGSAIFNGVLSGDEINENAVVNLVNASLCWNKTVGGSGIIYTNANLNITKSNLSNNIGFNGGAIVGRGSKANIYAVDSKFHDNKAPRGAVLQLRIGAKATALRCEILRNEASPITYETTTLAENAVFHIMGSDPCTFIVQNCPLVTVSTDANGEEVRTNGNLINGEEITNHADYLRLIVMSNPFAGHQLQIS